MFIQITKALQEEFKRLRDAIKKVLNSKKKQPQLALQVYKNKKIFS